MSSSNKYLLAVAVAALPLVAAAAPETYVIDPPHTNAFFEVDRFQTMTMNGRFTGVSGKFTLDRAAKTGTVELSVPTATVSIGDTERGSRPRTGDEHMRSADFFNVAEFPTMTFRSTKVSFEGDLPKSVEGQLTLLGVTRPVTLTFERFHCLPNPFNKRDNCGGNAVGKIDRTQFGMKYASPQIGNEVTMRVQFLGIKQ
jgi:polyisoprenoid-binding protein YceI